MAKSKIYGFNEDGFRRVVEATRRVLKTPSVGSQRRRQPPVLSGGISTEVVMFVIDSYDYATGVAVCMVEYGTSAGAATNEASDGTIEVIDPMGCNFNESAGELAGRFGFAAYLYPREHVDSSRTPQWVCLGLCCPDA